MEESSNTPHDVCQTLAPAQLDTILNTVLFIILFLTHLPQYIRIIVRRSTSGLSISTIILSLIFNTFLAATQLYYSSLSVGPIECCRPHGLYGPNRPDSDGSDQHLSGFKAYGALLALSQIGVLMLGSLVLFILFLMFPPRFGPLIGSALDRSSTTIIAILTPFLLLFTALYFVSALQTALEPKYPDNGLCCRDLPEILNWVISILPTFIFGIIQYVPQILHTRRLKKAGSLSVSGLMCQAPLLLGLGISLGLRAWRVEKLWYSPPDGWNKILSFAFAAFGPWMTAIAQLVLLCDLWKAGRGGRVLVQSEDNETDERTSLLRED